MDNSNYIIRMQRSLHSGSRAKVFNIRFDRQVPLISPISTIKNIAQMMTPANDGFGMNWNALVKNPTDSKTTPPETMPPSVVRTPLALLTAVRVSEPVTGIDWKNDPTKLHIPSANISCVPSNCRPLATEKQKLRKWNEHSDSYE